MKPLHIYTLLFVFLLSSCTQTPNTETPPLLPLETFTLQSETYTHTLALTGELHPEKESLISSKQGGRIHEIFVKTGDTVFPGKILAILESKEQHTQLATQNSQYTWIEQALEAEKKRLELLVKQAEQQVHIAETQLKGSTNSLHNTQKSNTEEVLLAKKKIHTAEQEIQNIIQITSQQRSNLETLAKETIIQAQTTIRNALVFSDSLLGVSHVYRNTVQRYEVNLGAKHQEAKERARQELRNQYDTLETIAYEHSIENDLFKKAHDILSALMTLRRIFTDIETTLHNSVSSPSFTEQELSSFIIEAQQHIQNIEARILSQNNQGIQGILLQKENLETTYNTSLQQAQHIKNEAEQYILYTQSQNTLSEHNLSTQQKTLEITKEQAEIALNNAKAARDSHLASMEQQKTSLLGSVKQAGIQVQNTIITSPYHGVITHEYARVGEDISPTSPIMSIADISKYHIKTFVPDTSIRSLHLGKQTQIHFDGIHGVFEGRIERIYPKLDPITKTLGIEIGLVDIQNNIPLLSFARIAMENHEEKAFFVPKQYIIITPKNHYILTASGEKKEIHTGQQRNNEIKIWFEGIQDGIVLKKP